MGVLRVCSTACVAFSATVPAPTAVRQAAVQSLAALACASQAGLKAMKSRTRPSLSKDVRAAASKLRKRR